MYALMLSIVLFASMPVDVGSSDSSAAVETSEKQDDDFENESLDKNLGNTSDKEDNPSDEENESDNLSGISDSIDKDDDNIEEDNLVEIETDLDIETDNETESESNNDVENETESEFEIEPFFDDGGMEYAAYSDGGQGDSISQEFMDSMVENMDSIKKRLNLLCVLLVFVLILQAVSIGSHMADSVIKWFMR